MNLEARIQKWQEPYRNKPPRGNHSLFSTTMTSLLSSGCSRAARTNTFPAFVRCYARKEAGSSDPKKDNIRRALYPSNLKARESPTGGWRPDVGRALQHAIPSVQAHETIERAWLLHKRHIRKRRDAELARKFECMKTAMQELYEIDSHLWMEANKPEDPRGRNDEEKQLMRSLKPTEARTLDARVRGLFPRELRIPTDTPSRNGWNYEWKPFHRPI